MRVRISHKTTYIYEAPARSVRQVLRMAPRAHDGQHIVRWRVGFDQDGRLRVAEDALGNHVHTVAIEGPIDRLTLHVAGEVETSDTGGVLSGIAERVPAAVFLRETALTAPGEELRAFADDVARNNAGGVLDTLHRLLAAIHQEMSFITGITDVTTTAAEAFALRRGVCQDLTHVFIAAARHRRIPARYVSGYFARADGVTDQEAGHAWAEALVPDLGWVGFDPANGICPAEAHIRVAIGLDYLGAAPVRGSRYGGGAERLDVALKVAQSIGQQ